jgi:methionyl-tRNA formyltransferase
LLPNYRGAAPIHHAVINGETESGCTTFFINEHIDTGNLLEQCRVAIPDEATTGEVYNELAHQGAMLLSGTVEKLSRNAIQDIEQRLTGNEKSAPKIQRDDCKINWNQPVEKIYHFVRGLSPFPCAFTSLNGETYKIYYALRTDLPTIGPGRIQHDKKRLLVGTSDFMLEITDLQPAGKKRMLVDAFSAGNNLNDQAFS